MDKSESIAALAAALAKAQGEMPGAPMNSTNPFLKNKYADLGSIISTAFPVLAKHGLAVSQLVSGDSLTVTVTTMLMHASGEYLSSTIAMNTAEERGKSAAMVIGTIITYLRRYTLASVLGMYADADDDGNPPQGKPGAAPRKPAAEPPQPPDQDEEPEAPAAQAVEYPAELQAFVSGSTGQRYVDMKDDLLHGHSHGLTKIINNTKNSEEKIASAAAKLEAIKQILALRNPPLL